MKILLASFLIFGLAFAGLAVGLVSGRKIGGSCGGLCLFCKKKDCR